MRNKLGLFNILRNLNNLLLNDNLGLSVDSWNSDLDWLLNNSFNFNDLSFSDVSGDGLFNDFNGVDEFLLVLNDFNRLFDDLFNLNWYFDNESARLFYLNKLLALDDLGNNLLNNEFLGDFILDGDDLLNWLLDNFFSFNNLLERNDLLNNLFNWLFDLDVDVLDLLNLNWLFDLDDLLDNNLNLSDSFSLDDLLDDNLDDLRNLDNLFNHSRNDDNLFDDLLDFNDFRYFNEFLDNLLNSNSNFFDSFDGSWYFNDLLNSAFNDLNILNVLDDWLLDLNDLGLIDNLL